MLELEVDREKVAAALREEQGEADPLSQEFREEVEKRLQLQWGADDAAYDAWCPEAESAADRDEGNLALARQLQDPELSKLDPHAQTCQALEALELRSTEENPRAFAVTFKSHGRYWSNKVVFKATRATENGLFKGSKFASPNDLKKPDYEFKPVKDPKSLKHQIEKRKGEWRITDLYISPAQYHCPSRWLNDPNVSSRRIAVAEIDHAPLAEQFARIAQLPEELQPTAVVYSSGKSLQFFWRCPEGCEWELLKDFQQAIAVAIGGVPSVTTAKSQRMRFP